MFPSFLKSLIGFILGAVASGGLTFLGFKLYFNAHPIDAGQIGGFFSMLLFVVFVLVSVGLMTVAGGIAGAFLLRRVW